MSIILKVARAFFGPSASERVEAERDKAGEHRGEDGLHVEMERSALRRAIAAGADGIYQFCHGEADIDGPELSMALYLAEVLVQNLERYKSPGRE